MAAQAGLSLTWSKTPKTSILMTRLTVMYTEILENNNILQGSTVKFLNIQTPKKFAVITLKFEQDGFTEE